MNCEEKTSTLAISGTVKLFSENPFEGLTEKREESETEGGERRSGGEVVRSLLRERNGLVRFWACWESIRPKLYWALDLYSA